MTTQNVQWWINAGRTCLAKDGSSYCGVASRQLGYMGKAVEVEVTVRQHRGAEKVLVGFVRANGHNIAEIETSLGASATLVTYGFLPQELLALVAQQVRAMHAELSEKSVIAWGW